MAALIPSANASGSGTMTLAGPSTNSNQTITIPDATGTMMVSGNMPAFSAYNSSSTTLNSTTWTKIAMQTEVFDTNNNFDSTTNYRFTPTIAGYYQLNGAISTNNPAGSLLCAIYKNGSQLYKGQVVPANAFIGTNVNVSGIAYFNGTTDYVELYGYQTNGSSQTTYANSYDTYFNGSMVRTA